MSDIDSDNLFSICTWLYDLYRCLDRMAHGLEDTESADHANLELDAELVHSYGGKLSIAIEKVAHITDDPDSPLLKKWSTQLSIRLHRIHNDITMEGGSWPSVDVFRGHSEYISLRHKDAAALIERARPNASGNAKPEEAIGKTMITVEQARRKAEAIVRCEGWPIYRESPSINRLAEKVGCHHLTLEAAIQESKTLQRTLKQARDPASAELSRTIDDQEQDDKSRHVRI